MSASPPWSEEVRLADLGRSGLQRRMVADQAARMRIAQALALDRLDQLEAMATVTPWHDGAEIDARWTAVIEQTCGVSLERFGSELEGAFTVRVLPRTSRHAPEEGPEVAVDPEAEDPPDLLDDDRFDLAAYVVEHLALEIDPFPRKPGVVFEAPAAEEPPSPFAILRDFKPRSEGR